jgi:glutaminyl-tRNA synthetase
MSENMIENNFIKKIIDEDLESGRYKKVVTRFPPEPNGYLHIGHARAIVINFELGKLYKGYTNLRFDDTNPEKESKVFVDNIIKDIKWLGYNPKNIYYASDYFTFMYERALLLIKKGIAYVDDLSAEEISKTRGNLYVSGEDSPGRNRTIEENLKLFDDMKNAIVTDRVLRAKIDMSSPNMNLRDPVLYRTILSQHHRALNTWNIYPMYDFAHPLEDAYEGISHSLCSLEFEDHRPLYDWIIDNCEVESQPRQIEFGRLSLEDTVMSKRLLRELVDNNCVEGWDDPRMPTISGLRNLGYTPNSIRSFILSAGLSKVNSTISRDMLESALRDDLVTNSKRIFAVIDPIKVTITNYPSEDNELLEVDYNNDNPELGKRLVPFGKHIYINGDDFSIIKPDKNYKRLTLGGEVRLMHAYFIKCNDVVKDKKGKIVELLCTYDIETKSGSNFNGRKPDGTIHFVSATDNKKVVANYFENLVNPGLEDESVVARFNKDSKKVFKGFVEPNVDFKKMDKYQFVRIGYFNTIGLTKTAVTFNRIVDLKSSYKKVN